MRTNGNGNSPDLIDFKRYQKDFFIPALHNFFKNISAFNGSFQTISMLVRILLAINVVSILRRSWVNRENKHRVLHYFGLIETHILGLMPCVYHMTVHSKQEKVEQMLQAIFTIDELIHPWHFRKTVYSKFKQYSYRMYRFNKYSFFMMDRKARS